MDVRRFSTSTPKPAAQRLEHEVEAVRGSPTQPAEQLPVVGGDLRRGVELA